MNGVFISHSTKNRDLVKPVLELLQVGMGRKNIFCTSLNEALPTGKDFISIVKQKMQDCNMVIALVTPDYLQSRFCVMELGAAWVQTSFLCPILAGDVDYGDLEDTPLKSLQMRRMDKEEDWSAIYDEMISRNMLSNINNWEFHTKLKSFMGEIGTAYGGRI